MSESGHSAIFHDFSGRFSGNGSELTGLVHIGIALGIFLVFIKLFVRLFGEFIAFFKDAFAKQNPFVNPGGVRRFMFGTVLGFLPMVLLLVPAGSIAEELRTTALAVSLTTLAMGNVAFLLYDRALHNMLQAYRILWQPRLHKMLGR